MPERTRRPSSSLFDERLKRKKPNIFSRKNYFSERQLTVGIAIGITLTLATIAIHCIACFTPHWKEVSPNTPSVYVDGIDALIRTEILIYFNTIHRFTRHAYGLFQRCEYLLSNITRALPEHSRYHFHDHDLHLKRCTKNYLPIYTDEKFNECHSLQYYRFCSKASGRFFDIKNDFLRATYDIISHSGDNRPIPSTCNCYYPDYLTACQALGILALICLIFTALFYGLFPFLNSRHTRLKYKCLAILAWLLSILFMLINILVFNSYFEYESLEYVAAIERHYRSSQIYSLSEDAKTATERFRSSLQIKTGYSSKLAWLAFALTFVDGLLIMFTCKVSHLRDDTVQSYTAPDEPVLEFRAIPYEDSPIPTATTQNKDSRADSVSKQSSVVSQIPQSAVPAFSSTPPSLSASSAAIPMSNAGEPSPRPPPSRPSCLKRASPARLHFEDEV